MPGRSGSHYISVAAGWSEWGQPDDILWYEVPEGDTIQDHVEPSRVEGIWVHAYDPENPDDDHWFWVRSYMRLNTWDEWDDLIEVIMDMHNMAMA